MNVQKRSTKVNIRKLVEDTEFESIFLAFTEAQQLAKNENRLADFKGTKCILSCSSLIKHSGSFHLHLAKDHTVAYIDMCSYVY
jgi:hypothetical protein